MQGVTRSDRAHVYLTHASLRIRELVGHNHRRTRRHRFLSATFFFVFAFFSSFFQKNVALGFSPGAETDDPIIT
jgi:hypothetical protein